MATLYVDSVTGSDADNGTTWALAKATLTGVAAIDAAGDTIWVSDNHAESTAGAISFDWAGTVASPTRVQCGDDAAEPPTSLAATATVSTTGNSNITLASTTLQVLYWRGITFQSGVGATGTASIINTGNSFVEASKFRISTTGASSVIRLAASGTDWTRYKDCTFRFGAAGQTLSLFGGRAIVEGGSIEAGGTSPTTLVASMNGGSRVYFEGFDLSAAASTINLCSVTLGVVRVVFRNCKLPASWSGSLHSGTPGAGAVIEMINCDNADTTYRYRKAAQFGTVQDETTLVRTGGADIDSVGMSWQMVSNANAEYPMLTLDSPEIQRQITSVGSAVTLTVHFLRDSATNLTDAEIWMRVQYLGTSGVPLGSFISDAKADVLASAADQSASSETWTTTGMANPNEQQCSVTFTPQEAGMAIITIHLAKASTTVYVCPKVEQS